MSAYRNRLVLVLSCQTKLGLAFCAGAVVALRDAGLLRMTRLVCTAGYGNLLNALLIKAMARCETVGGSVTTCTEAEARWMRVVSAPDDMAVPSSLQYTHAEDPLLTELMLPVIRFCTTNYHWDILRACLWSPCRHWGTERWRLLWQLWQRDLFPESNIEAAWHAASLSRDLFYNSNRQLPTFVLTAQKPYQRAPTALTSDTTTQAEVGGSENPCEMLRPNGVEGLAKYLVASTLPVDNAWIEHPHVSIRTTVRLTGDEGRDRELVSRAEAVVDGSDSELCLAGEARPVGSAVDTAGLCQVPTSLLFIKEKGGGNPRVKLQDPPDEKYPTHKALIVDGLGNTRYAHEHMSHSTQQALNRERDIFLRPPDKENEELKAYGHVVAELVSPGEVFALQVPERYRKGDRGGIPGPESMGDTALLRADAQFFHDVYHKDEWLGPVDKQLAWMCASFGFLVAKKCWHTDTEMPQQLLYAGHGDPYRFFDHLYGRAMPVGCRPLGHGSSEDGSTTGGGRGRRHGSRAGGGGEAVNGTGGGGREAKSARHRAARDRVRATHYSTLEGTVQRRTVPILGGPMPSGIRTTASDVSPDSSPTGDTERLLVRVDVDGRGRASSGDRTPVRGRSPKSSSEPSSPRGGGRDTPHPDAQHR